MLTEPAERTGAPHVAFSTLAFPDTTRETLTALRDSGFAGYMSLEPHLAQAGRLGGFSGPEGFRRAAAALKLILNELAIPWR